VSAKRPGSTEGGPGTVREYCLSILESGDLASKLRPPRGPGGAELDDRDPGPSRLFAAPARDAELRMSRGSSRLPRAGKLHDPAARAVCLSRFAHHELMAVELFAWALLYWPDLPGELRRGFLRALGEEQVHLRLYLDRLRAEGYALGEEPLSDWFWRHVPAMASSSRGPLAFLSTMGLTLEQANLDHSIHFRDAFRQVRQEDTARVLQRVHDDEIRHVRLAAEWLARLKRPEETDVAVYLDTLPSTLDPRHARGRRLEVGARRRAGLSEAMIDLVARA